MSIIINNPEIPETLIYDHILLKELKITQPISKDGNVSPVYNVSIDYAVYALDSSNQRHFKKVVYTANINDYKAAAMAQEALGDTRMINALEAIEAALSQIITAKGNVGNTTVVAG